jgi:hypothetical protein
LPHAAEAEQKTLSTQDTGYVLGNLFLTEENLQIDWNIALQVVQLPVQAVERTLEKTALLVLTKEELIT